MPVTVPMDGLRTAVEIVAPGSRVHPKSSPREASSLSTHTSMMLWPDTDAGFSGCPTGGTVEGACNASRCPLLLLNPWTVVAFWAGFTLVQLLIAVYGFRLDGEALGPLWALPLQQLVYRQLMYLVLIESALSAARGLRIGWQRARRTGRFDLVPSETADQPAERASSSA